MNRPIYDERRKAVATTGCPRCGAAVGQWCRSMGRSGARYDPRWTVHAARMQAAAA